MKVKINNSCILIILLIVIIFWIFYNLENYNLQDNNIANVRSYKKNSRNTINSGHRYNEKPNDHPPIIINIPTKDYNYDYNEERLHRRLHPPGKYYEDRTYMPINIRTRGLPTSYQQIGILTNVNNNQDIKPLYGRQTYGGSQHWNYYSSTDSNLELKIPVYSTNKKCTDERGCSEIRDNDNVQIGNNGLEYRVSMYSNDNYRYIPYI